MRSTVKVLPFLKLNLLLIPLIASSIALGYFASFITSYICALIHELAHIITAKLLRVGISHIELHPFGVCARLSSDVISNPASEILISISGPLCSLALAIAGYVINAPEYFVLCNGAMAAVNLLPILPLDGGRIMRAGLCMKTGAVSAYNTATKISRVPLILLFLLAIYSLVTNRFNFSLILIGVFLFANLLTEQHNVSRQAVRELLGYKKKLHGEELSKATVLCADSSTPARKILRHLSYSRYHIIHVTDENMNVVKTLTEGQLLNAVSRSGIRTTLKDIK